MMQQNRVSYVYAISACTLSYMVLDLRCITNCHHQTPEVRPRGASNLGISSLVPGIGSYRGMFRRKSLSNH
eukprot:COSAG02_NODE_28967_length_578_cov_1.494781_1_plen_70_part_01